MLFRHDCECPSCHEVMIEPCTVPCGHQMCIMCVKKVIQISNLPVNEDEAPKNATCKKCESIIPSDFVVEVDLRFQRIVRV